MSGPQQQQQISERTGVLLALFAYVFWGVVTIFWRGLAHVPLLEIIAHRTLWSCLFVALWLGWQGRMDEVRAALADRSVRRTLVATGLLLLVNWLVFVWAVAWGSVLEVSLGYFINPLVSVALGTLLLGERLNRAQQAAVALACIAVSVQAIALGTFPFVALWLALTFAGYGYYRKTVNVRAAPGLFVESLVQLPFAIAVIGWFAATSGSSFFADTYTAGMLLLTGPVTAVPLITFAAAARRLRLATMGLLQYSVPSLQFLLAIQVFHEPLGLTRLATFAIIWLALIIFTTDALARERRTVQARKSAS